jgi:uncharacterized protein (TIGR02145 family)
MFVAILFFLVLSFTSSNIQSQETIRLGKQEWMKTNLSVTTFRNGDSIVQATSSEEWTNAGMNGIPAWCYYDNDKSNGSIHGVLYNQHAVLDPRGLAPIGWHIPDVNDWKTLFAQYGGENEAGFALISKKHWFISEWTPQNNVPSSGFEAFGSGARDNQGTFYDKEKIIGFFTINNEQLPITTTSSVPTEDGKDNIEVSVEYESRRIQVYFLNNITSMIGKYDIQNSEGYSIRCIKD